MPALAPEPVLASNDLTLHDAAELLGVHYMTAYRYVRLGLLPARKDGATWRVARADLDRFRDREVPPAGRGRRRAPWDERFEARLVAGDARGAWGVVEAALAAGTALDAVYLEVIAPALASIGQRWADGEIDVAVEHRASGIATRVIGRLGPRFARRGRTRGTVVLGAPAGDRHALPVSLLADLVRGVGFEVVDLGADVPASSFAFAAVDAQRLVAVGVSVSTPGNEEAVRAAVEAIRGAVGDVPLLIGGGAVQGEDDARRLGADGWAADGRGAVELLERLTPWTNRTDVR